MSSILSDLVLLLLAASGGTVFGYVIRLSTATVKSETLPRSPEEISASDREVAMDESRELLLSIKQVAQNVALKVGAHGKQVRQFNTELHESGCDVAAVLAKLITANERMEEQLAEAEVRLKNQANMIEMHISEARTDALTGLVNRRAFNEEMLRQLERFKMQGIAVSVLMLDIDNFKKLNDAYGHVAGDDILMSVGKILSQHIRSGDTAARYGGEEFAVILPRTTGQQARMISERIRRAIASTSSRFSDKPMQVTASAGLSELMLGDSIKSWLHRADDALYRSKAAGRNCGHWHDGQALQPLNENASPEPKPLKLVAAASAVASAPAVVEPPEAEPIDSDDDSLLDPTTQLLTTEAFHKYFARMLTESRRTGGALSVIMIRVDRLNEIADQHGVNTDGQVMRIIGRSLASLVRSTDCVARYHNDSFGVMLPETHVNNAAQVAERIRSAVSQLTCTIANRSLQFTVSIGVGDERGNDGSPPLIDRVKSAVSLAATRGGNQIYVSDGQGFERLQGAAASANMIPLLATQGSPSSVMSPVLGSI